jgi:mono/diheme cytochrome c family protein
MKLPREVVALGVAGLAMAAALGATAGLAGILRAHAARVSRQLPDTEPWFAFRPAPSPELVTRGRGLFRDSCAHCHGFDARGDEGPDLHDLQVSDRYIANTIRRGIKGEMPSFARKHGAVDASALLAYVRSLAPD